MFAMVCTKCGETIMVTSWGAFEKIVSNKKMPCCNRKFSSKEQKVLDDHVQKENAKETQLKE